MIDLNELKRLAQAATEGPWEVHTTPNGPTVTSEDRQFEIAICGVDADVLSGKDFGQENAAFIVAANPEAVLELTERCERAEEESRSARELAQRLQWDLDTRTAKMLALSERVREWQESAAQEVIAHIQTLDERDSAEQALAHAYFLITGKSPQWSNLFGHAEALNEIDDAQRCLRAEADHKGTARLTLEQLYLIHALLMPGIAHGADHTESAKDQMRSVIAAAIKEAKGDEGECERRHATECPEATHGA